MTNIHAIGAANFRHPDCIISLRTLATRLASLACLGGFASPIDVHAHGRAILHRQIDRAAVSFLFQELSPEAYFAGTLTKDIT